MIRILLAAAFLLGAPLAAQRASDGQAGPRDVLPREREIALARSAAPADVSAEATVLVWDGSDFVTAVEGGNGVTCLVGRSWPESLEPHCFDEEGTRTILPIHLEMYRLQHAGADQATIDASVAEGLRSGRFRLPSRPAMSYMMSSAQELYDPRGEPVGAWHPHLMIYYPYLTEKAVGLGRPPSTDAAVVVDPGSALSNLMIVVRSAVDPDWNP